MSRLRLLRSYRVAPSTYWRLMREHQSGEEALRALPEIAARAGVKSYAPCSEARIQAELSAGRACGAVLIEAGSDQYPKQLLNLVDPPPFLWAKGNLSLLCEPQIALIAEEQSSSLAIRTARALTLELMDAGYRIVTSPRGMISDMVAKTAANQKSPGSIAVHDCGIDLPGPEKYKATARTIAQEGLLLSEEPVSAMAKRGATSASVRMLAGLAQALTVIEAPLKSPSLASVSYALDLGRDVMAVPGHPFERRASGTNALIRDGAILIRGGEDIINALGGAKRPKLSLVPGTTEYSLSAAKDNHTEATTVSITEAILAELGTSSMLEDQMIERLGVSAHIVIAAISQLELEGAIMRNNGGKIARC